MDEGGTATAFVKTRLFEQRSSRQAPGSHSVALPAAVVQELRLLDREYFKFLFRLVKRKAEEPFSPPSSMRRTEAAEGSSVTCPDSPEQLSSRREAGADQEAERLLEIAVLFMLKASLHARERCPPAGLTGQGGIHVAP